jgi:hypothetical protein
MLAGEDTPEQNTQKRKNAAVVAILHVHFAYIDKPVKCNAVRPFLPNLADPLLEIRVPTPITAHLDHCEACTGDMLTLRGLGLTHKQLCRLAQSFADETSVTAVDCSKARDAVASVAAMDFSASGAKVLNHLTACPDCRQMLYQQRQKVLSQLPAGESKQGQFPCQSVSTADLFNYCFPYGIDPAQDQYAKFRPAFTSHVSSCTTCLDKMQRLHRTICDIAERPQSQVVTYFTFKEPAHKSADCEAGDLYAGWSVDVQVTDEPKERSDRPATMHPGREPAKRLSLSRFVKPALAAAAVIVLAAAFFFGTSAKAVELADVYKALAQVKNICISSILGGQEQPYQKIWISRTRDVVMSDTKGSFVLWDLPNKVRKIKDSASATISTVEVPEETLAKVQKKVLTLFGVKPFSEITDVPKNAKWHRVPDEQVDNPIPGTEVYDLIWAETGAYDPSNHKRRFFVDPGTDLPVKVERYLTDGREGEYELFKSQVVTYVSDNEIGAVIEGAFGPLRP